MPDIFSVLSRRWQLILLLTLAGAGAAFIASLASPKLYLGQATALPANSALSDKARIFNNNIEGLYSELGSPDDLERIEGTAKLDTPYLALVKAYRLANRYGMDSSQFGAEQKAALRLQKSSNVARTGYGELQVKVWDKDPVLAATLANALLQTLNEMHSGLQVQNNKAVLRQLKEAYYDRLKNNPEGSIELASLPDSIEPPPPSKRQITIEEETLNDDLRQYTKLIHEYELSLKTAPKALLVVEAARPQPLPDRPKTARNVLLALAASLLFSFLLALFIDSRKTFA